MGNGPFKSVFKAVFSKALLDAISGAVAPATLYVLDDYVVSDYVD